MPTPKACSQSPEQKREKYLLELASQSPEQKRENHFRNLLTELVLAVELKNRDQSHWLLFKLSELYLEVSRRSVKPTRTLPKTFPCVFLGLLLFTTSLHAQNPSTATFPGAAATDKDLWPQVNRFQSTLAADITSGTISGITLGTTTGLITQTILNIDSEYMMVCEVTNGTQIKIGKSSCPNTDGRGLDGSSAASHSSAGNTNLASGYFVAGQFNQAAAEIKAVETWLLANSVTTAFKAYYSAAGCNQTSAGPGFDIPSTAGATATCYGTAPVSFGGLDFIDVTATAAQLHFHLPADWTGAVDLVFDWFCSSSSGCSTNQVDWQVTTVCVSTGALNAPTFNTTQDNLFAASATQYNRLTSSITGITTTGCSAGNTLYIRIGRNPANGSDTLAATATLLGVEVTYRRAI